MEDILEQIKDFADNAHGDQKRKYTPERYIVHPVRVMHICKEYTNDISILAAALLHDVLEDTTVSKGEMQDFLIKVMGTAKALKTVEWVEELTDRYIKDKYPQWNRKKRKAKEAERIEKTSAGAQTVKYADIIDNSIEIADKDTDFAPVFLFDCSGLLKKMPKGDSELRQRAVKAVNEGIKKVKKERYNQEI